MAHVCVEKFSQGKKDAPSSLDKVTRKIAEIITIAEESQYPAMLAKWKSVRRSRQPSLTDDKPRTLSGPSCGPRPTGTCERRSPPPHSHSQYSRGHGLSLVLII